MSSSDWSESDAAKSPMGTSGATFTDVGLHARVKSTACK